MSGFSLDPTALTPPVQRLKQIATDLAVAASGAGTAASGGKTGAGDPAVVEAAGAFAVGIRTVLTTLGEDAGLIADKVQQAGIAYDVTDRNAMPSATGGGPDPTGRPPPGGSAPNGRPHPAPVTERVATGDSLWAIAERRLGPDATPAAVTAEWRRWYAANRGVIGPDPDRLLPGTTLRAPDSH